MRSFVKSWFWWLEVRKPPVAFRNCCVASLSGSLIIFSLQVSPMKLECLTTGKLGNSRKLPVKWWRWAAKAHFEFGFCRLQGQIQTCVLQWLGFPLFTLSTGNFPVFQSIIRVVFHDRRLQYTEHQQLEGWRWNRPGDRILDLGKRSVGMCSVCQWSWFAWKVWCWSKDYLSACVMFQLELLSQKHRTVRLHAVLGRLTAGACHHRLHVNSVFLSWSIADIPMSVGIIDPRANPTQLNTVEFLWDPSKRTSVFIQVLDRQQCFLYLFFKMNLIPHASPRHSACS